MKIFTFGLLLSTLASAGPTTGFGAPGFLIAGHNYLNPPPIQLACGTSSNTHCTFRKLNASSGYTPSGSNKFYLQSVRCTNGGSSYNTVAISYTTNDVGVDSGTAFTGQVFVGGTVLNTGIGYCSQANSQCEWELGGVFAVPNGDYLSANLAATNMMCYAWGYEGT